MSLENARKKATTSQKNLITSFLSEHEGMRTKKFTAQMTYQKYQDLWKDLTSKLNDIGPNKNMKDWQKYWNDQRSRVKRKAAEIKCSQQKTGGGVDMNIEPLSVEDENILQLMGGNIVVCGDNEIIEAGLPIVDRFPSEENNENADFPTASNSEKFSNSCTYITKDYVHKHKDDTPNKKRKKYSDSTINQNYLIEFQTENNDIQREIANTMKERNVIEENKVKIKKDKLAALLEKNELEQKKIDAINNMANILLNLIPSTVNKK